ncbi:MAG: FoF1 ATP synthase subunit gamma, partial [Phycisphaerae bacterium]
AVQLFRAICENQTSEHGARMTAMDNATENADEMIGDLTRLYNRARQQHITRELLDIVGGANALQQSI